MKHLIQYPFSDAVEMSETFWNTFMSVYKGGDIYDEFLMFCGV